MKQDEATKKVLRTSEMLKNFSVKDHVVKFPTSDNRITDAIKNLEDTTIYLSDLSEQTQNSIRDLTKLAIILALVQLFIVIYPMYLQLLSKL